MAIVSAALNHFRKRKIKSAQIVGISSIAGDRGFPGIASYSSSKIGITRFLDSVRGIYTVYKYY
jgi:NADP-dependent 3-hydroxy acid dehydrogenase YdfG